MCCVGCIHSTLLSPPTFSAFRACVQCPVNPVQGSHASKRSHCGAVCNRFPLETNREKQNSRPAGCRRVVVFYFYTCRNVGRLLTKGSEISSMFPEPLVPGHPLRGHASRCARVTASSVGNSPPKRPQQHTKSRGLEIKARN